MERVQNKNATKMDKKAKLANLKGSLGKRSITGIFLAIGAIVWMFIGAVYLTNLFGNKPIWAAYTFMGLNTILLMMGIYEIVNLRKGLGWNLWIKILVFIMAFVLFWMPLGNETFGPYVYNSKWFHFWITLIVWVFFIFLFVVIRFSVKGFTNNDLAFVFFWTFYLVFVFKGINFLMLYNDDPQQLGWPTFVYLWVIVLSNDIFAYLGGSLWGKHYMVPRISPKKTWEGAASGFTFGVVLSMTAIALMHELGNYNPLPIYETTTITSKVLVYLAYFGLSCFLSFLSQIGDLMFSLLKRNHKVKDFSNIFPGHGGLLDRLDGFSLVILFTFILTVLIFT